MLVIIVIVKLQVFTASARLYSCPGGKTSKSFIDYIVQGFKPFIIKSTKNITLYLKGLSEIIACFSSYMSLFIQRMHRKVLNNEEKHSSRTVNAL